MLKTAALVTLFTCNLRWLISIASRNIDTLKHLMTSAACSILLLSAARGSFRCQTILQRMADFSCPVFPCLHISMWLYLGGILQADGITYDASTPRKSSFEDRLVFMQIIICTLQKIFLCSVNPILLAVKFYHVRCWRSELRLNRISCELSAARCCQKTSFMHLPLPIKTSRCTSA